MTLEAAEAGGGLEWLAAHVAQRELGHRHLDRRLALEVRVELHGEGDRTQIAVRHCPPRTAAIGNDPHAAHTFSLPYDLRINLLKGDWYDAAKHYRTWALTQPWSVRGPLASSPAVSRGQRCRALWSGSRSEPTTGGRR